METTDKVVIGVMIIFCLIIMGMGIYSIIQLPRSCERLSNNLNLETRYNWNDGCLVNYNNRWIKEDKIYALLD